MTIGILRAINRAGENFFSPRHRRPFFAERLEERRRAARKLREKRPAPTAESNNVLTDLWLFHSLQSDRPFRGLFSL